MANADPTQARRQFFKRYHHLPEAAWAAVFSVLTEDELRCFRAAVLDPDSDDPQMKAMRSRYIVGLKTLDAVKLLEDPEPTGKDYRQVRAVLGRISSGRKS